jgi:prefoldin subunit 5
LFEIIDNWLAEKSSKQAIEVIDRRIKGIKEHLEKLQKEIKTFNDQLNWTNNIISVILKQKN